MPRIFVIATGAIFLFYGLRWFRREHARVETSMRRSGRRIRRARLGTPLVYDAATGCYRPAE